MFHQILIVGNLGRDPEMRYTPDGTSITNFSVAVEDGFGGKTKTVWYRVSVFGKQAEPCNLYLHKGARVLVIGRPHADENGNPRVWKDKQGNSRASFEVTANRVVFLTQKPDKQEPLPDFPQEEKDDDIPF